MALNGLLCADVPLRTYTLTFVCTSAKMAISGLRPVDLCAVRCEGEEQFDTSADMYNVF